VRLVVAAAILAACAACARPPVRPAGAPLPPTPLPTATTARSAHVTVELLGATVVPGGVHGSAMGGAELGGLSACAMDEAGDVLAVSDDRDYPSLFRLSVSVDGEGLHVKPLSATPFERAAEHQGAPALLDLEGMALVGPRLMLSSEGDEETGVPPALLEYTLTGRYVGSTTLPRVFLAQPGQPTQGLRSNLAFEGLTRFPDGRLLMGAEAPTVQDGEPAEVGRGAWARWLVMVPDRQGWVAGEQFAYPIDPLPPMPELTLTHQENGVSEVLALSADRVLALERGFVRTRDRAFNVVRLYDVSLSGADDVSARPTLEGAHFRPLQKTLVADLDETRADLGPELGLLANFEALCVGPPLPDGTRTLLLISDNNFSPAQRMAFVLLRLDVH
jgi:hypothetical protein